MRPTTQLPPPPPAPAPRPPPSATGESRPGQPSPRTPHSTPSKPHPSDHALNPTDAFCHPPRPTLLSVPAPSPLCARRARPTPAPQHVPPTHPPTQGRVPPPPPPPHPRHRKQHSPCTATFLRLFLLCACSRQYPAMARRRRRCLAQEAARPPGAASPTCSCVFWRLFACGGSSAAGLDNPRGPPCFVPPPLPPKRPTALGPRFPLSTYYAAQPRGLQCKGLAAWLPGATDVVYRSGEEESMGGGGGGLPRA